MWLRLTFYPGKPDLSVIVTTHGKIYFRAEDVGKFLGYCNLYKFAKRYAKHDLMNVFPKSLIQQFMCQNKRTLLCFTFKDIIKTMKAVRISLHDIDIFTLLWEQGQVLNVKPDKVALHPKDAEQLIVLDPSVKEFGKTCLLQDWIKQYVILCKKKFKELDLPIPTALKKYPNTRSRQNQMQSSVQSSNDCHDDMEQNFDEPVYMSMQNDEVLQSNDSNENMSMENDEMEQSNDGRENMSIERDEMVQNIEKSACIEMQNDEMVQNDEKSTCMNTDNNNLEYQNQKNNPSIQQLIAKYVKENKELVNNVQQYIKNNNVENTNLLISTKTTTYTSYPSLSQENNVQIKVQEAEKDNGDIYKVTLQPNNCVNNNTLERSIQESLSRISESKFIDDVWELNFKLEVQHIQIYIYMDNNIIFEKMCELDTPSSQEHQNMKIKDIHLRLKSEKIPPKWRVCINNKIVFEKN